VTLENQLSLKRNNTFQDELLADEILRVLELNSVSQTLRLLGAPVEPIFDMHTGTLFLKMHLHSLSIVFKSTLSPANTYTITNPMRSLQL